jgi:hypothetical protein
MSSSVTSSNEQQSCSPKKSFIYIGYINLPTAPFVWLISHQSAVLLSQNKPATNNQSTVVFSQNKPAPAISHQPNEQAV